MIPALPTLMVNIRLVGVLLAVQQVIRSKKIQAVRLAVLRLFILEPVRQNILLIEVMGHTIIVLRRVTHVDAVGGVM
jgi:hypothetical protein